MTIAASPVKPAAGTIWRNGALAAVVAAVVNAILYFVGAGLNAFPQDVMTPAGEPITLVPVLLFTIVPIVLGTLAYTILSRFTNRAYQWLVVISLIIFVAMIYTPFSLRSAGATPLMIAFLEILHIPPVAALLYFLRRA
jgi:predicted Na+-dependent transporter